MKKIKQIAKYTTNILAIIGALVSGINAVEGITIPYAIQIVQVIAVIQGVLGTYLLGNKAVETARNSYSEEQTDVNCDTQDELIEEGEGVVENEN